MDMSEHYRPIRVRSGVRVERLYTLHYFENHSKFYFEGESHDFWELAYVDRGEVVAETDGLDGPLHLKQGDIVIYRPNEFHRIYANSVTPFNMLNLSFSLDGPLADYFLSHTVFHTDGQVRFQLGVLLDEAQKGFSHDFADPRSSVERRRDADACCEQVAVMMLEWLLIQLYRSDVRREGSRREHSTEPVITNVHVKHAIQFMKENISQPITLADICAHVNFSRSQLQKLFREQVGVSVIQYLIQMRIDEAKFYIRYGDMNFTEISRKLCYSSIHHFSKQFRQITGISPSEYAVSVFAFQDGII